MAPKKISAKEVLIDIRAGLSNEEIGKKYGLSEKRTLTLLDKLLSLNLLSREEFRGRLASSTHSIDLGDSGGSAVRNQAINLPSETPFAQTEPLRSFEDDEKGPHAGSIVGNEPVEPAPQPGLNGQKTQEDVIPALPNFIDVSKQGENRWWRYLVSILFILISTTEMSGIAVKVWAPDAHFDETTGSFTGMDSFENFILQNLFLVFLFVAVFLAVRFEHKRPFLSLITPNQSIDWEKIGKSFGLFCALLSLEMALGYVLDPASFQLSFDPSRFFLFAAAVLVLTPIQTTAEELFFRGFLLQMMALLTRNRYVLVFISGVLFMLPHLVNPEVALGFVPMSLYYFAVGGFLTLVTLKSNSLEVAIGMHAAMNLFGLLIVNYANSPLKTESIFFLSEWDPIGSLVAFCIMAAVFYLLMFGARITFQRPWKIWTRTDKSR